MNTETDNNLSVPVLAEPDGRLHVKATGEARESTQMGSASIVKQLADSRGAQTSLSFTESFSQWLDERSDALPDDAFSERLERMEDAI